MSTSTRDETVVDRFAADVRRALDDLASDDVEELTDGLEADLAERAADTAAFHDAESMDGFGDPSSYAAELRAAAGLPPRSFTTARQPVARLVSAWLAETRTKALRRIRSQRWASAVLGFALALRPAWWVLRGWALYQVIVALLSTSNRGFELLPATGLRWAILIPLVIVSVQWGRGQWMPRHWLLVVKRIVSTVAAIVLVGIVPLAFDSSATASAALYDESDDWYPQGLTRDGVQVRNIFAYDSNGKPIEEAQLFDQNGQPLDLVGSSETSAPWLSVIDDLGRERLVVPSDEAPGRAGWNVYPLREADPTDLSYTGGEIGEIDPRDADKADPPFRDVQALVGSDVSEEGTEPTSAPSATPSPTPLP